MAKRRKPSRKRSPRRHSRRRQYPYEDWPAFKPVPTTEGCLWELDLDELTPKQRAEWDRVEAERERSRKLHERFAKKMAHRAAVRDGLLPPPWLCETQGLPAPEAQETPVRRITAKNWITVEAQRLK